MIPFSDLLFFRSGFYPSQNRFPGLPNSMRDGANVWCLDEGLIVSDRGYLSSGSTGGANPLMVVDSTHGGPSGLGTITTAFGTNWIAGTGPHFKGGSSVGSPVGSQLSLIVGGIPVAAGLAAPSAPTFADSGVVGTKLNGSYSVALVAYRSTTGAVSSRSAPSSPIAVKNKKGRITFPAAPTGATHWLIYGSRRGFGSIGPWFRLTGLSLTAVPVGTATLDVEWFDGELGDIAPINYDPSPSGVTHCVNMGGSMVALVGNGLVYPSIVGKPEAFPPEFVSNLAVREAITGCTARGLDGLAYVSTANSLNALVSTGSELTPVIARGIWADVGFAHGNAWCVVENEIYGFSGTMGPVRTHGGEAPDTSFARPVLKYMRDNGWTPAGTVVVNAPNNGAVLFCFGGKALPFMRDTGIWSAPITLPGSANAGIMLNSVGFPAVGGALYKLDASGTTSAAFAESPFYGGNGGTHHYKVLRYLRTTCDASMTVKILKNLSSTAAMTQSATAGHGNLLKKNQKGVRSYALRVEFSGANQQFHSSELEGLIEPMHV